MTDQERLGPPPVEPMSDVAWARVERNLWSRIDTGAADALPAASKRRWLWIAVPTLAVAAVVALLIGTGVFTSRDTAPVISLGDPTEAIGPSRVVAGAATTSVSFGDAHIDLAAQSAIVMSREAGSPSVLLERGVATFAVAPRAARQPFVVRAGDTVVRVVGTKFTVARSEERITVTVEQGLVDVQFRGDTRPVGAGQTWTSDAPTKTTAVVPPTAATTASLRDTITAAPRDTMTTVPAPRDSTSSLRDTPRNPTTITPRDTTTTTAPRGTTTTTAPRGTTTTTAPRDSTTAPRGTTGPSKLDEAAEFDRLTGLEARDPAKALAGYLAMSRGNTRWSGVALYAAGRLAADRKDPRAATFLDIYLRRFPGGANAADARDLLNRLKGATP